MTTPNDSLTDNIILNTTGWEILTPTGFRPFLGIRMREVAETVRVECVGGYVLECTEEHPILTAAGLVRADQLNIGDLLVTAIDSMAVEIKSITKQQTPTMVYDPIEVNTSDHLFCVNGLVTHQCLLLDEFAFVPENIANEFYASTFPTITSGKETKIIMVSTPNGMNLFHKFWMDAEQKHNDFKPLFVHWSEVPGRDEAWKQDTIRNIGGPEKFAQEYECVGPETIVTVRDTITGHIRMMNISDLYEQLYVN